MALDVDMDLWYNDVLKSIVPLLATFGSRSSDTAKGTLGNTNMLSYGNTGTPITMDMGGFEILYREPICGGNRRSFHKTDTMLNAVAEFNTLQHTSMSEGKPFETPLSITRLDIFGNKTHRWNMDGRYSVPRLVGGLEEEKREYRRNRRSNRRYR